MKYYGAVGYVVHETDDHGVSREQITERVYCGDVTRRSLKTRDGGGLNDDFEISNIISIAADPYALKNLGFMRYVTWMNSKWKILSAEYVHPRINITLGGVYNG